MIIIKFTDSIHGYLCRKIDNGNVITVSVINMKECGTSLMLKSMVVTNVKISARNVFKEIASLPIVCTCRDIPATIIEFAGEYNNLGEIPIVNNGIGIVNDNSKWKYVYDLTINKGKQNETTYNDICGTCKMFHMMLDIGMISNKNERYKWE